MVCSLWMLTLTFLLSVLKGLNHLTEQGIASYYTHQHQNLKIPHMESIQEPPVKL